jgi:hypothetical protein
MSVPEFVNGEVVTLEASVRVYGELTDPTTVTLTVTDPSANAAQYTYAGGTVTRVSEGQYRKQVTTDEAGTWIVAWAGTGTVVDSKTDRFQVVT